MRNFVINTYSESGDHYTYFINHNTQPSNEELERFLAEHANDKYDGEVYESIENIVEIEDDKFLTIPE